MSRGIRRIIFLMFLASGFCGLLYQIVWIRIAYASFGVITPVMSVVISVFMSGLLLGSATGGAIAKKLTLHIKASAILLYAAAEFIIGIGAFCVPRLFSLERHWLFNLGAMNSYVYLAVSGLAIAVALLPWCVAMGCTYPFMMTFIRERETSSASSFSFLYLANVIGAMAGTIITAVFLIELFGFSHTLVIAAACNFTIAAISIIIGGKPRRSANERAADIPGVAVRPKGAFIPVMLFISGFAAMSMEIVWTRNFTIVLGNVVYSYAALLTAYLCATWFGSYLYRKHLSRSTVVSVEKLLGTVSVFSLLPLLINDPGLSFKGAVPVLLSILPLSGVLGYLTPLLIDVYSKGEPSAAGWAYAVNTLGCILGPLFASYLFLPAWGVKTSLLLLSAALMVCFLVFARRSFIQRKGFTITLTVLFALMLSAGWFLNDTYEEFFHLHSPSAMRRDYAATVTSVGRTKDEKRLLINGIGMTVLTPVTQFMAHLPLAYCEKKPASALAICFGMGTTFRSLVSWGIDVTVVELIPGVPKAFSYFWPDADSVLHDPKAKVVIDDGRRYLMRTEKKFDVITIDPPPPIKAAGSSLLYSVEMYSLAKQRLNDDGILQQWIPLRRWDRAGTNIEMPMIQAAARSIAVSFPYVKVFRPIEGAGYHFLASMKPLRHLSAAELVSRMPARACRDLLTWCPDSTAEEYMQSMLSKEIPLDSVLSEDPGRIITDEKPYNEYYLLRRISGGFGSSLAEYASKLVKNPVR